MPKTTDFTAMPTNASVLTACKSNAINELKTEFGIHLTETETTNLDALNSESAINKFVVSTVNAKEKENNAK